MESDGQRDFRQRDSYAHTCKQSFTSEKKKENARGSGGLIVTHMRHPGGGTHAQENGVLSGMWEEKGK